MFKFETVCSNLKPLFADGEMRSREDRGKTQELNTKSPRNSCWAAIQMSSFHHLMTSVKTIYLFFSFIMISGNV